MILYSNTKNAAAIKLYEKLGFSHVEVEKGVYERANVKMIIDVRRMTEQEKEFRTSFNKQIEQETISE